MARIDLEVPYQARKEAKSLGAHWDEVERVWFVTDDQPLGAFRQWRVRPYSVNVIADDYRLARVMADCPACGKPTKFCAFLVLPAFRIHVDELDADGGFVGGRWEERHHPRFLTGLKSVDGRARPMMASFGLGWRVDYDRRVGADVVTNHCNHCMNMIVDATLHEPGAAFCPLMPADASRIELHFWGSPLMAKVIDADSPKVGAAEPNTTGAGLVAKFAQAF